MSTPRSNSGTSASDYQVFLNFRGADTRNLIDILRHFLVQSGIRVFYDDESLRMGNVIGKELYQAIERSNVYVVMLSKRYAESKWCLQELTHMVKCSGMESKYGRKVILPAFYDVSVETVKLKDDRYKKDMQKLCAETAKLKEELPKWEDSLVKVAKMKGRHKGNTGAVDFSQMIVREVQSRLVMRPLSYHEIGIDEQAQAVEEKLDVESGDVRFLVICGEERMGKTTLARAVFNRLSARFQGSSFIADVPEMQKCQGYGNLRHRLRRDICGDDCKQQEIKQIFRDKKVLIVLDGVDKQEQIDKLAGSSAWFGPGSRIIITSSFLEARYIPHGKHEPNSNPQREFWFFEMKEMEFTRALELFGRYAFWQDSAWENYDIYSRQIVNYSDNNPLILEIMGSFLHGKRKTEEWKYVLDGLQQHRSLQRKLRIIYNKLQESARKIFLDIACFFINEEKTNPEYMWDHPNDADGIKELLIFSLVKIVDGNKLWMHDSLRDFGRDIVCQNCEHPKAQRSRFWEQKEALEALLYKEEDQIVEAICSCNYGNQLEITDREFSRKPKLRFLKLYSTKFNGDFRKHLMELRWLSWHYSPDEFQATNFASAVLVILDLAESSITADWAGWRQLQKKNNLKVIDLTRCQSLTKTPNFSLFNRLERLILEDCTELAEVDGSIGELNHLKYLNIRGCDSLGGLPEKICSVTTLEEILIMKKGGGHFTLPSNIGSLTSLTTLEIVHVKMDAIPDSIENLEKLQHLSLLKCSGFKGLPESLGKLRSLAELQISKTEIEGLPESIGSLKELKVIKMEDSSITGLPCGIIEVEKLEEIHGNGSKHLRGEIPDGIEKLGLKVLELHGTSVKKLPQKISHLSHLQKLQLPPCCVLQNLSKLPGSLTSLGITFLPSPQDQKLLDGLTKLEKLELHIPGKTVCLTPFEFPRQLKSLHLSCQDLQFCSGLPNSLSELILKKAIIHTALQHFNNLQMLSSLELDGCKFVDGGTKLGDLTKGFIRGITGRTTQPENAEATMFTNLNKLKHFHASRCDFGITKRLHPPKGIRVLNIHLCSIRSKVLQLSGLGSLRQLEISECKNLVAVEGLGELASLEEFEIRRCCSLKRLVGDLSKSKRLKVFVVSGNDELEVIEPLDEAFVGQLKPMEYSGRKLPSLTSNVSPSLSQTEQMEIMDGLSARHAPRGPVLSRIRGYIASAINRNFQL